MAQEREYYLLWPNQQGLVLSSPPGLLLGVQRDLVRLKQGLPPSVELRVDLTQGLALHYLTLLPSRIREMLEFAGRVVGPKIPYGMDVCAKAVLGDGEMYLELGLWVGEELKTFFYRMELTEDEVRKTA